MVERAAEHVDRAGELHTTHHHHHVDDVHDVDYRADHDHGGDPINHDSDIHIYPDNYFDDCDLDHGGVNLIVGHLDAYELDSNDGEFVGTYLDTSDTLNRLTGAEYDWRRVYDADFHRRYVVVHRRVDRR